ncbi:MAG: hypothetical protein LH473_07425, partial [Chitinophagales bacterium]|nr:hypothetical protein [Chitinophagales bacterium]
MKTKLIFISAIFLLNNAATFAFNPTSKGWTIKDPFLQKVFIQNNGQFSGQNNLANSKILFTVDNEGARIFFTSKGLTFLTQKLNREHDSDNEKEEDELKIISDYVHMQWIGANENAEVIAEDKVNDYYTYADAKVENGTIIASAYKTITYKNTYDGIDVIYSFPKTEGIKYAIVVNPGADVSKIKMNYSDAEKLFIDKQGNLHLRTKIGDIIDHAPKSFYDVSKEVIYSSFVLSGNEISFQLAQYDNSKTVVIDPWTINPNFSGQNSGWDIDKDGQGNIYCQGGDWPYYLKKFSSTGTLIWTYTYPNSTPYMGDHATTNAGFNYISYGPWIGPYFSKINPAGSLVFNNTTTNIEFPQGEMYRITLNCKTGELFGAGFAYDGINLSNYTNICSIDTSTGKFSNYQMLYSTAVETRSLCYDPAGGFVYALVVPVDGVTNPTDGNRIIKNTNLLAPIFNVKSNYTIMETSPTYTPSWFNGFNGIAVGCYLYTCDGQTLKKWDKETGVQIGSSVTIPSGGVQANSGLYLDQCGNIYCGSNKTIIKYDASLTQLSTATTDGKVFDICAGIID